MKTYPGAITYRRSPVSHPKRTSTLGILIHWTAGYLAGDLATLTGGNVDCQFYISKAGDVHQLMDADSSAWHGYRTANYQTIGIEHEGFGQAWPAKQLQASAKLSAWLCQQYNIPIRHTVPSKGQSWLGIYGHADLQGIDGNNHSDSVPTGTGWDTYIAAVKAVETDAPPTLAQLRAAVLRLRAAGKSWADVKRTSAWALFRKAGGK